MRNTPGRGRARTLTSALVNGTTLPLIGRSQQNQHSTHQVSPHIQTGARSKFKESQHERSASSSTGDGVSDRNVDCDETSTSDIAIGHTPTYSHILKSKVGPPPKHNKL